MARVLTLGSRGADLLQCLALIAHRVQAAEFVLRAKLVKLEIQRATHLKSFLGT